jgi:hypothetical protein
LRANLNRNDPPQKFLRVPPYLFLWIGGLCLALFLFGCKASKKSPEIIAKAGSQELTKADLAAMADVPADSIKPADRRRLVENWVERALVEQEAKRRKLDRDPAFKMKMDELAAELFRSRLLAEIPAAIPADTAVQAYYVSHRSEFLRPVDANLIELYWAEQEQTLLRFREALARGDTNMVSSGEVNFEGRWLAESGELAVELEREISTLKTGEITFPRPFENGYRIARLVESYPAGTVLDLSAVKEEIRARLLVEAGRKRQDSLLTALRERYPVRIFATDTLTRR